MSKMFDQKMQFPTILWKKLNTCAELAKNFWKKRE